MDSSKSSPVSGDLTSTMESVLVTSEQDKDSSKNGTTCVGDSVPSSSSDANVQATVLKTVLDDPISSTSDTINSVSETNLKNDVNLETGAESEGAASNASELVTDSDFFSSELNMGSICTEKISEDVEDIATDLENLLGESSHEYSISSNTDKSFDLESFESQNNKSTFEGATQTKDITTTDTSEDMRLIDDQPEEPDKSASSGKTQIEEESLSAPGAVDTLGYPAGTSENTNQISESAKSVEYSNELPQSDIKSAEFVLQEEVADTKPDFREIAAEDDQSDDEEVYGMILQIRDDNQDSTTGDEARTEEDSQESLAQRDWSVKTPSSEETPDLTCIDADQISTDFQKQQTSEEPSSLFEVQKESGEDNEFVEFKEQSEVDIIADGCADNSPDKPAADTSDFAEENTPAEQENDETNQASDLTKIQAAESPDTEEPAQCAEDFATEELLSEDKDQEPQITKIQVPDSSDKEEPVQRVEDSAAEELLKNDDERGDLSSNTADDAMLCGEETQDAENEIGTENAEEQITPETVDADEKLFQVVADQQHEESLKITRDQKEDLITTETGSLEVTEQSVDRTDFHGITELMEVDDHNSKSTSDEAEENVCAEDIEQIAEGDDKKEESIEENIAQVVDENEEDSVADLEDVIKSESLKIDDIQSTSDDFKVLGEENIRQTDVEMTTGTLNAADDETVQDPEDKIVSNSHEFITVSPKSDELPDLNEFQISNFGEGDKKEDQLRVSDSIKNDLLDVEAVISMDIKDAIDESLTEKLTDSVTDGEAESKSEESPKEAPVLFASLEELVQESLDEEIPDVGQSMSEAIECITDAGSCSAAIAELVESQFSITAEQKHIYEADVASNGDEVVISGQMENPLIIAPEQELTCETYEGAKDLEDALEMKSADLEKTEPNENADVKLLGSAEDTNLIVNNTNVLQTSSISEVNDETMSLELKVLQSLEESVEAICAISKEETANKETEDFFRESENSETAKFPALDDVEALEVSSTIDADNEFQKGEPEEGLGAECFNTTQFVADVQSVEDCIQLQIDGGSTEHEIASGEESVDAAGMDTQDSLLADEILQKEIENLEGQDVFPILEENFGDAMESHQDMENVQHSDDLTKVCELDDQFEVNEACKYIEASADETRDSEETVTETIELQLVEDDKDSDGQKEEYENMSAAEDIVDSKVEEDEEVTEKSGDDESASVSNVIVEEVDDQSVNPDEGNDEAKELLESVCIEEISDDVVMSETESESKPSVEPLIDVSEEQSVSEVSSSVIIEADPKAKVEESPQESPSEHKKQDSEYSSKMSSDQNLKMTITKHRVEDTVKYEAEYAARSESGHSILKIFDSHESIDDREKEIVPRLIIKPVVKLSAVVEEVEQTVPKITIKPIVGRSSPSEALLRVANRPESPKVTRSQKCDMLSPLKLTIKPVLKLDETQQQKCSPKLTIKPILKMDELAADSSVSSLKITIKPIVKPREEDMLHSPKITIKPIVKPPEQECELLHSPRITIKPVVKPSDSPKKSPERDHSPRITIKPIVKPADEKSATAKDLMEGLHNPRITIKPLIKPEAIGKQDGSKKTEQEVTSAETSHSPRITIKPIVKPVDEQKQSSKQESSSTGSPKITIKPIVKPQEIEEDPVRLIDFEDQIKQERIVLKINKNTKSTRKRQAADATEKLAKIKVKYSRERGRAQIVSGQGKLKRALEGSLDPDFKRVKFEAGDLTITPINPVVQIEKIEDPLPPPVEDDPLENIPVFEITPETAAVLKSPLVEVQPLPPAPRKRGRPRKIPLVAREEFNEVKEEKPVEPPPTPPVEDTGRPKRSCRGPSVRTTLGIKPRKPRGSSRGRGRGRGSRGGGTTRGGRQQRVSASKLKLLKEEAASAIAEETKRLDEQKDVEMREEVPENVDAGTTNNIELVIIEEETRMSADINNSRAQTPAKQVLTPAPGDVEDTQSSVQSTATTESVKVRKGTRLEVHQEPEGEVISAEQLAEYYWGGGGPFMLQEQVAQFLGIKSFKRKYPGITRRPVDMQERDFIRESGLASEAMCDLGLTAVSSADILDIMYSDFQHKYEEYCKHQRDRQAKDFSNKQKALSLAASQEKNKQDIMQQAVQSAASWNATFNKARKDERKSCMDLQTFTVHYPKGKMKKIDQPKVGFYPVALVPGQYTDYYKTYTPTEINNLPLNTMLYEPINVNDEDSHSDGSGSESDSSSSSSGSSSSDSSGEDNCNVCSPASSTNKKAISTTN